MKLYFPLAFNFHPSSLIRMTIQERSSFDMLCVGVLALDRNYTVHIWNAQLVEWTQLGAQALLGEDIRPWFETVQSAEFQRAFEDYWVHPHIETFAAFERLIPCRLQGDTFRVLHPLARRMRTSDGTEILVLTLQDITAPMMEIDHLKSSLGEIAELWRNDEEIRILNEELEKRVGERTEELERLNRELSREVLVRKEAELSFRQSEQFLSLVVESVDVGIALLHHSGRYIRLNPKFCDMFGYKADDLLGKHFSVLYKESDRREASERLVRFVANDHERQMHGERHFITWSGKEFYLYFTTVKFIMPNNDMFLITTAIDITELRRAQEETRIALQREQELNKLKANFVTVVSHEFRTPMTVIYSSSEILQASALKMVEEKRQKLHFQIQRSVRRMTELLDEVVFIERSMKENIIAFLRPTDVYKLCNEAIKETLVFDSNDHIIETEFLPDPAQMLVPADSVLLRSIISNLLSNALKFSSSRSTVKLRVEVADGALLLEVRDNGIGIPPENYAHVYDLFYRGNNVGVLQGTGMGLTIVKRSVDAHRGTIRFESELGQGTTFFIRLPTTQYLPSEEGFRV
ncbi:MAG: PAS domain S-box protein [Candidatus Kapaibacterium sp.]|nr:MAG: PAS domain S-box protein [Candidatus Kapabacteria bacterium]